MASSSHDIRKSADGKFFICKRCGVHEEAREAAVFTRSCSADLYENRVHPSHRMRFTVNKNRPDGPDWRACTSCEISSPQVDTAFSGPCAKAKK